MIDDEVFQAVVLTLAETCEATGHTAAYHRLACDHALQALAAHVAASRRAHDFDAGKLALEQAEAMPAHSWSTAGLMRTVHDALLGQPRVRGLHRATVITMGLARLAERGFPADAFVRTCMRESILRRMTITLCAVWEEIQRGERKRADVPELATWLEILDEDAELRHIEDPLLTDVLARAHTSGLESRIEDWLADASLTHILGWRLSGYARVDVPPNERQLPGGRSATRWVFQRFTETYLDKWDPSSLQWEFAFSIAPDEVASRVGFPVHSLVERAVTQAMIASEICRRAMPDDDASSPLLAPYMQAVGSLLEAGETVMALQVARRGLAANPNDPFLELCFVFCLIPHDPPAARRYLQQPRSCWDPFLVAADLASTHLMEGDLEKALTAVASCDGDTLAWLWTPASLPHEPRVDYVPFRAWKAALEDLSITRSA